jgi:pyrroline-5-carboxylate reductase
LVPSIASEGKASLRGRMCAPDCARRQALRGAARPPASQRDLRAGASIAFRRFGKRRNDERRNELVEEAAMAPSVGFVGGGRVTRIVLSGWARAAYWPARVVVSDPDGAALGALQAVAPRAITVQADNGEAARQDVVVLALHPPALRGALAELRGRVSAASIVVSLAPKLTLGEIRAALGAHARLARVIPNAPSVVGAGFNPVCFSPSLAAADRDTLAALLAPLGAAPEVAEADLEAYALLTGMGPTYLWFQLYELLSLGQEFGLERRAAAEGLRHTVEGAVRAMAESGLTAAELMDLVPVRPLAEDEATFKAAYRKRLVALHEKIRPAVSV